MSPAHHAGVTLASTGRAGAGHTTPPTALIPLWPLHPALCAVPWQTLWRPQGVRDGCGAGAAQGPPPAGLGMPFITGDGPCRGIVT